MPRYEYIQSTREKFVNPYTFVPVDFGKKETKDINAVVSEASELLTGMMKCTIYAKTPLAIPDISSENIENEHSSYSFESTPDGQYMIPASSLRGMIRSVYETATNSCFSTLKENTLLNARKSGSALQAGLLMNENGEWKLYEATRYMLRFYEKGKFQKKVSDLNVEVWKCPAYEIIRNQNGTFMKILGKNVYSGEKVHFLPLKDSADNEIQYKKIVKNGIQECAVVAKEILPYGGKEGYLVLGESMSNKHHESIFEKKERKKLSNIVIQRAMEGLDETVKVYRSNINRMYEGKKHCGYPEYERMKDRGCIPVWYLEEGRGIIFSLAAMGRISFQKTLNQHINQKQPCQSREKMCKACLLLGMAQKDAAVGGRIRFTDAIMQNSEKMGKEMIPLAELGTPRPSYMPFYSTMKAPHDSEVKFKIPNYDTQGVTIRGRKYYWHSKDFKEINQNAPSIGPDAKRNASMQVADIGSKFVFELYFDRITLQELRELVWTLNFWENKADGKMCHKIGHGKPIGLGSVEIVVDQIMCRSFSEENGYEIKEGEDLIDYSSEEPFNDSNDRVRTIASLKRICNFNNAMKTRYPYIANPNNVYIRSDDKNALASHHWFGENKSARMRGHDHPMQLLPDVLKAQQDLTAYDIAEQDNRQYRSRR